jgi:hypothetical protein
MFNDNPLTQLLQPQQKEITKTKRFKKDRLNISDIQGAQPDVYKK